MFRTQDSGFWSVPQVLGDGPLPAEPPPDVLYLCGLELRGARWSQQLGALQDSGASLEPRSTLLISVRATVGGSRTVLDSPQLQRYHCPLYVPRQQGGGWSLLTRLPLSSTLPPAVCGLRGVRLLSLLSSE